MASISESAAIEHRQRLDVAYIAPGHHTDAADDHSARVIVTLDLVVAHAYG